MKRILLLTTALVINGGHVLASTSDAAMTSPWSQAAVTATEAAGAPVLLASNDDSCGTTSDCGTSFSDDSEDDSSDDVDDDATDDDEADDDSEDSGDDHDSDSDGGESDGGDSDGGDSDD
ncbi:MAG: hypothetical protein ACOY5U_11535 [Pseudomonadota bacterium]